jgi:hypothetical protein
VDEDLLYARGYERVIRYKGDVYTVVNRMTEADVIDSDGECLFSIPLAMHEHTVKAFLSVFYYALDLGRTIGRTELQGELRRLIG